MRLNTWAFGIAAGATAAMLFTLCALAVAIAPGPTTAFFGFIMHMDLTGLTRSLTVGSFAGGLVAWALGTALAFGFTGWLYNRLIGSRTSYTAPAPAAAQRA
jgi:membrane protein YqaA with SNARE-associated domain